MSNVVSFKGGAQPPQEPPEVMAWVCACGCTSFFALEDGTVQCCSCQAIGGPGGFAPYGEVLQTLPTPTKSVINHQVEDFNLMSMLHAADTNREDLSAIILVYRSGELGTWSNRKDFETPAQHNWLRRRTLVGTNVILDAPLYAEHTPERQFPVAPKLLKKHRKGRARK